MDKYTGNDNSGNPKAAYLMRIGRMTDTDLAKECEMKIWLSAYASNNPRSDYHWHADACYDECERRDKSEIYEEAWKRASATA